MAKIVTLGEIMLRLSPPGYQRIGQAVPFDICYGGAEANVASSLALFGHHAVFLSAVPDNPIGDATIGQLKKLGVNCSHIVREGRRLGIYFLENGASVRPSSVIYDRQDSSITQISPDAFDFDDIFCDADLFHVSGITPVLSKRTAQLTLTALQKAKEHGVTTSFDLNYRARLWTDNIPEKQQFLSEMMAYVDICFGNARDAAKCLGYSVPGFDLINGDYGICVNEENMRKVMEKYHLLCLVTTLRRSISASDNTLSAALCCKDGLYTGRTYPLHIVDRVGGGDSFAAGFLHGYLSGQDLRNALEFAIAASALKHTQPGDINYTTEEEVLSLLDSDGNGRVQR